MMPGTLKPWRRRWPYASGIDASDWMMIGARIEKSEEVNDTRIVIVNANDLEIFDTWFVSGLAGTGSKDVACDD